MLLPATYISLLGPSSFLGDIKIELDLILSIVILPPNSEIRRLTVIAFDLRLSISPLSAFISCVVTDWLIALFISVLANSIWSDTESVPTLAPKPERPALRLETTISNWSNSSFNFFNFSFVLLAALEELYAEFFMLLPLLNLICIPLNY